MYTPPAFRNDDPQAAFDLIARHGFATLITIDDSRPVISHLPMIADPVRRVLRGHLARANPHAGRIDGRRHTAIFIGADAYVSPDWYGDAEQVPTWNYSAVHVTGAARALTQAADIDMLLEELSDLHESRRHDLDDGTIWKLSKLPQDKLRKMRAAIVAFEIDIEEMALKAKLSQNKDEADFATVMAKLAGGDENQRAVAAAMRDLGGEQ